nr:Ig-like domain-containing protein [Bacilli bacterium]
MKKSSILLTLASAALLASCGGGTTTSSSTPAAGSSDPGTTSSVVSSATEEKIVLTIDKATIKVGETAKVTSSVEGVAFSSRDESVASVDATGTVTALKPGTTKIQARKDGYKIGSVDITVEKASARAADYYLEFEDAEHYDPDGVWGYPQWGIGPGDTPVEETEFAHGGKSVGWFTQGCKETIHFSSDKAGTVEMDFMMAYNAEMALDGVLKISVNGVELSL